MVTAGLILAAATAIAGAGAPARASAVGTILVERHVTVAFQIWDRDDQTSYVVVSGPGGRFVGLEREPTPGDGLGGVRKVIDTVTRVACNHSPPLCRLLTAENEIRVTVEWT